MKIILFHCNLLYWKGFEEWSSTYSCKIFEKWGEVHASSKVRFWCFVYSMKCKSATTFTVLGVIPLPVKKCVINFLQLLYVWLDSWPPISGENSLNNVHVDIFGTSGFHKLQWWRGQSQSRRPILKEFTEIQGCAKSWLPMNSPSERDLITGWNFNRTQILEAKVKDAWSKRAGWVY